MYFLFSKTLNRLNRYNINIKLSSNQPQKKSIILKLILKRRYLCKPLYGKIISMNSEENSPLAHSDVETERGVVVVCHIR